MLSLLRLHHSICLFVDEIGGDGRAVGWEGASRRGGSHATYTEGSWGRVGDKTHQDGGHKGPFMLTVFSPFVVVSMCGVAGLSENVSTHSSRILQMFMFLLTASFLLNLGLSLGIFMSATAAMFSVSSLLLTCWNHSNLLMTVAIGSTLLISPSRLKPIGHHTIRISVVAIRFSSFTDIGHVS